MGTISFSATFCSVVASFTLTWMSFAVCGTSVPCAPLGCVSRLAAPLGRYASTAVEGQLLACRWPCVVGSTTTPLGAAAEEQPLVPAADDSLGDSL